MKVLNRRYQLLEPDGEDHFGITYTAVDLTNQKFPLRIKVINSDHHLQDLINYFSDEFIKLVAIEHENILPNYRFDIITTLDNKPLKDFKYFYVTGFYKQSDLLQYTYLSYDERMFVLMEVCYAIQFLHFRGVSYNYLTFDNVLITRKEDGGLCVMLRDLASIYGYLGQGNSEGETSQQTIAPEVILRNEGNHQSDLYSLGVMAYYLISGNDFRQSAFDSVRQYSHNQAIQHLIESVTAYYPADRLSDFQQFMEVFTEICPFDYTFKDKKSYERLSFNIPLVGREKELSLAKHHINSRLATLSGAGALFVSGESGIGKSRLLRELHYSQRIQGMSAVTVEIEKDYEGYHTIFAHILQEIIKICEIPKSLTEKYGPELVKIIPTLREVWGVLPSEPLKEEREILKLNNRIASFILELSQTTKLFLCFDNIDEFNDNEMVLFENLITLNERASLFIVGSYCLLQPQRGRVFIELIQKKVCVHIALENYAIDEASLHLQHVLFMSKKPLNLATRILADGSGNPRYIEEVIKTLFVRDYIYIHETRKWHIVDDIFDRLELPQSLDEATLKSLNTFNALSQKLIEAIAVYGRPISKEMLSRMANVSYEEFDREIVQLIELKILQIKYSDWGYTYDFYNRNLARLVYSNLSPKHRQVYHQLAADLLESRYNEDGLHGENLLRHLIYSNQRQKSVEYAMLLGDKMCTLAILSQALVYYNQALNLFADYDNPIMRAKVIASIADIHFKTGENKLAYDLYHQLVDIAEKEDMHQIKVDAVLKILEIMINRKLYNEIESLIEDVRTLCIAIDYRIGLLELGMQECRFYLSTRRLDILDYTIKSNLDSAYRLNSNYYIGRYLNFQGIAANTNGDYDLSFKCFLSAASYLEQTPNCSDLSRAYNNLGVISMVVMGDVRKARSYFERALEILMKYNVVEGRSTYLANIGETYATIGENDRALPYYLQAEQIAEDTQNVEGLMTTTISIIDVYLALKQYTEVYRYIVRFEKEFEEHVANSRDMDINVFYLLCATFYMRMREFMLAKSAFDRIELSEDFFIDSHNRYRYYLTRFVFLHLISGSREEGRFDLEKLKQLKSEAKNQIERALFQDMVLDLAIDLSLFAQVETIRDLLLLYERSEESSEYASGPIKYAIASIALNGKSQIEQYEAILITHASQLNAENKWIIHLLIGSACLEKKDTYKALLHHLDALDSVHELSLSVPPSMRSSYVLNDAMRMKLYMQLQKLKVSTSIKHNPLSEGDVVYYNPTAEHHSKMTLDRYFDIGDLESVFTNEDFMASMQEAYTKRYNLKIAKMDDLMRYFMRDQSYNIQLVIRYLTQLTLSQVGFIYELDENGDVMATFKSDQTSVPIDIMTFVKQHYEVENGLLVEHKRKFFSDRVISARKSVICMPIYNADYYDPHMRRRYDEVDKGYKEILGYLYLESDKLLNNINEQTFEQVKELNNLLYVLLDNFKLKKDSTIDKLTGVYLRRFIETEFNKELMESRIRGSELSVIMADIDHFKSVNDIFGHRKGDEVLQKMGEIIMSSLRHGDYVGRYGGEEFIVILPKTGSMEAYRVSEKIRERVKQSMLLGEDHPITISLGVSTFPSMGQTEEELIERADQALYESKNLGRDRTTLYDSKIRSGHKRYDKLAGILSGNVSNDARVIKALVDLVDLISEKGEVSEKIDTILSVILDITEGQTVTLVAGTKERWTCFERYRGSEKTETQSTLSKDMVLSFMKNEQDDFFIHWNDIADVDQSTGMPNWKSYIVCPLVKNGDKTGMIIVRVPIKEREFEFKHYNFVKRLSSVVASIV